MAAQDAKKPKAAKVVDDDDDELVAESKVSIEPKAKKERKVFVLPGQTKELLLDAPESESLRIFYTTLREQRPESEIAPLFLMQHGLLSEDEAAKLFKTVSASKAKARAANGVAPSRTASASTSGQKRVRKPDPRRAGGKAVAAAKGDKAAGATGGKAAAAPRKRAPATKKAAKVIDDDDDDDDDNDDAFSNKPAAKKAKPAAAKKFTAIIDDDDSD